MQWTELRFYEMGVIKDHFSGTLVPGLESSPQLFRPCYSFIDEHDLLFHKTEVWHKQNNIFRTSALKAIFSSPSFFLFLFYMYIIWSALRLQGWPRNMQYRKMAFTILFLQVNMLNICLIWTKQIYFFSGRGQPPLDRRKK